MGVLRAERFRDALRDVGFIVPEKVMNLLVLRYMRKDGMLRFGDFVSAVMHLHRAFGNNSLYNSITYSNTLVCMYQLFCYLKVVILLSEIFHKSNTLRTEGVQMNLTEVSEIRFFN